MEIALGQGAGEHGRLFAVVADEVSALADRGQPETKTIAQLINDVRSGAKTAVTADQMAGIAATAGERSAQVEATAAQAAELAATSEQLQVLVARFVLDGRPAAQQSSMLRPMRRAAYAVPLTIGSGRPHGPGPPARALPLVHRGPGQCTSGVGVRDDHPPTVVV